MKRQTEAGISRRDRVRRYGPAANGPPGVAAQLMLRGGRLAKHKGRVASIAPLLASVSVVALAMAVAPTSLHAGSCTETGGVGSGIWTCSGAAGADVTQFLTPAPGGALVATTDPGFGINTAVFDAIQMFNGAGTTSITFTDNNNSTITGFFRGIYAINLGTGSLSVTTTGDVTGTLGTSIYSLNVGTNLTVTTGPGTVLGGGDGIDARNYGSGALSITTTGDVTGTGFAGILARNRGTDLTISTGPGTVLGGLGGIVAENQGSGALSVTTTGDVTGTNSTGIFARNNGTGDLTVNAGPGTVMGGTFGIDSRNYYGGALSVTTTGDVTGTASYGIRLFNFGTDLTITTGPGTVMGGATGIFSRNYGSGALSVTTTGDVMGTNSVGIFTDNFGGGTDLNVTTGPGTVSGGQTGIFSRNFGSGALTVTTTGEVTGTSGYGIVSRNYVSGDFNVNTGPGTISGGASGILAGNYGTGALSITTTGDVTGTGFYGIRSTNFGTNHTVTTGPGAVQGQRLGIRAQNFGSGALTVTTTGDVTGTATAGIYSYNRNTDLTVTTGSGAVTGGVTGIYSRNLGTGDLTVTTGPGTVTGSFFGINSRNYNGGALSVTTTGDVTGTAIYGIRSLNFGTDLTISTGPGTVSGGRWGINSTNLGSGALTVTTTGDVTGTLNDGIYSGNFGGSGFNITTGPGTVLGGRSGIFAINTGGAGVLSVTSSGAVTGGTGFGIYTFTGAGKQTNITLNSGADVSATSGLAIFNDAGDSTITMKSGSKVTGQVLANDGSDDLVITGTADIAGVTLFDGGDDTSIADGMIDTVTFQNAAFAGPLNTGIFQNFEGMTIDGGVVAFTGGPLTAGELGLSLINGGVLDVSAGSFTIDGDFNNTGGVLNMAGGPAGSVITVNGDYTQGAGGVLIVDVNQNVPAADKVVVNGSASVAGSVVPNVVGAGSASGQVNILTATGGVTNNGVSVTDTAVADYTLLFPDANTMALGFAIDFTPANSAGLTPNQFAVANNFNAVLEAGGGGLNPLLTFLVGVVDLETYASLLDRLHPEHYLAQVQNTILSHQFFMDSVMSCPTASGAGAIVAEDQCVWAKIGGRTFEWDRSRTNIGGDEDAWNIAGGAQVALSGNWRLGAALSYENSNLDTQNAAHSEGDRLEGALVLKNRWGNTSLAAAAFGGHGWFDTERTIGFAGIGVANGDHEITFGGVHARLGHTFDQGRWYFKPMVDFDAIYLDYGGFRETGGGAASLNVRSEEDWVLSASPALEIGGETRLESGAIVRPFVRAGVTFFNDTDFQLTSSFLGAPSGVPTFTVGSEFEEVFFDVSAGVDVMSIDGFNLKLNYGGRFSEDGEQHSGGIKFGAKF